MLSLVIGAALFSACLYIPVRKQVCKIYDVDLEKERGVRTAAINEWAYGVENDIAYWKYLSGSYDKILFIKAGNKPDEFTLAELKFDYSGETRVEAVKTVDKEGKITFLKGTPLKRLPKEALKAVYRAEKNDARRISIMNKVASEAVTKEASFNILEYEDITKEEFDSSYSKWELSAFSEVLEETFTEVKYCGDGIFAVSGIQ